MYVDNREYQKETKTPKFLPSVFSLSFISEELRGMQLLTRCPEIPTSSFERASVGDNLRHF